MKLLIVTQKIDKNDDVLGFFHGWVAEFAKHCEKVTVITLGAGEYDLPRNVEVLSLGKEEGKSRLKYTLNFYKYIWSKRKDYDDVFVHMNPEYVVLGGILWRITGKKIGLWYTHKAKNLKLYIASKLANIIFTASSESFGLKSKKLHVLGHGIDIEKFKPDNKDKVGNIFNIVYVGRISLIKNQQLLTKAVDLLVNQFNFKDFKVSFVGSPLSKKDEVYKNDIDKFINDKNIGRFINFVGSVPNKDLCEIYNRADLSINLCPTGGMDKTVLESVACGLSVIALNKTFSNILPVQSILETNDAEELAKKIIDLSKSREIQNELRLEIVRHHSSEKLIQNIINTYHA